MDNLKGAGLWDSSPKTTFYLGLFTGIAVSAVLALVMVFSMLMGGQGFTRGSIVATDTPPAAVPPTNDPQPAAAPVKGLVATDHVIGGNANSKVTVIEYSDFECPFCGQFTPATKQMLADFPNDVRLVYRHYPLSFHQNAQKASEASECVAKLKGNEAFWKMHDQLFANQTALGTDLYTRLAKGLGVNEADFKKCLDSGETASTVSADMASGNDAGVNGTPATFINGKLVSGAVPYATLKQALVAAGAKN